jgi:hypothetical protein
MLSTHIILVCIKIKTPFFELFPSGQVVRILVAFVAVGKVAMKRRIMGLPMAGAAFRDHLVLPAVTVNALQPCMLALVRDLSLVFPAVATSAKP